jgi:prepilin-type N-terminal cleavage/methylation domain-containing protein/prepilin-type processing-associated H-X9-DG protein
MQAKKGFTLIELLVVIAIIAILAAILFPVFANARDKARQISDLSNLKQVALGIVMYTNDYDDTYPIGEVLDGGWGVYGGANDNTSWLLGAAPYISGSDVHVFYGPNDTGAGTASSYNAGSWTDNWGKKQSIGVNALDSYYYDGTNYSGLRVGIFGAVNDAWPTTTGLHNSLTCKMSEVTQSGSTVLLSDLQSSDVAKYATSSTVGCSFVAGIGNPTGLASVSLIGQNAEWAAFINPVYYGIAQTGVSSDAWDGRWMIPNPARIATNAYPYGPNGIVSAPFSSKTLANFAFTDGHAKAMKPVATNPDGQLDANNLWLVNR